jgi:hypothetical protein
MLGRNHGYLPYAVAGLSDRQSAQANFWVESDEVMELCFKEPPVSLTFRSQFEEVAFL